MEICADLHLLTLCCRSQDSDRWGRNFSACFRRSARRSCHPSARETSGTGDLHPCSCLQHNESSHLTTTMFNWKRKQKKLTGTCGGWWRSAGCSHDGSNWVSLLSTHRRLFLFSFFWQWSSILKHFQIENFTICHGKKKLLLRRWTGAMAAAVSAPLSQGAHVQESQGRTHSVKFREVAGVHVFDCVRWIVVCFGVFLQN